MRCLAGSLRGSVLKRHCEKMEKGFALSIALVVLIVSATTGCKEKNSTEPAPTDTTHNGGVIVRKPNIYLYPTTKQQISVWLLFPSGGNVLESKPAYGSGWLVDVEPSGTINGQYGYLYYEARTPDRYQYTSGWVVQKDTIAEFFSHILNRAGFIEQEIKDFVEYWSPLLRTSPYYLVYPQEAVQIENVIRLKVVPAPQAQLRMFFVIRMAQELGIPLLLPQFTKIERKGYVLAEWGVVIE